MNDLYKLIYELGEPKALIDHWDHSSKQFAIWDFDETFEITHDGIPLINDKKYISNPLNLLQETLDNWKNDSQNISAIGYISYDLKNLLFPKINFKNSNSKAPLLWFGKPKKILPYKIEKTNRDIINNSLAIKKDIPHPKEYEKNIKKIKKYLQNGVSYQINFTQQKKYKLNLEPFDTYLNMRENIQPHYGMYLNTKKIQILSFSPERFFKTEGSLIKSFPMKGTRPRSSNIKQDQNLLIELSKSNKDKAEHLMIVDLMRNDLGKICKYGSINVNNLYNIDSFKTVHQMVSEVYGKLDSNITEIDVIKALFPGGSITGAPKESAMKIIDLLENYQRNIYTGSIGFINNKGDMDFNIAIRTMTVQNKNGSYPVGGGIVWDSNPLEEWQEAQLKSQILFPFNNKKNNMLGKINQRAIKCNQKI